MAKNQDNKGRRQAEDSRLKKKSYVLVFGSLLALSGLAYFLVAFYGVSFEQLLFHASTSLEGANMRPFVMIGLVACLILGGATHLVVNRLTLLTKLGYRKTKRIGLSIILICSLVFVWAIGLPQFVWGSFHQNDLMAKEYVDPRTVELEFPEHKRNLIYIYLESMESSYSSKELGGAFDDNYIPQLSGLALDQSNVQFSNQEKMGGAQQVEGVGWTIAGMVAQTAGIPLKTPLKPNVYGRDEAFLPGACALGDILADQGYYQEFLLGSDARFGSRDSYFRQHGDQVVNDLLAARAQGKVAADYHNGFWGYDDRHLFAFAKERLTELSRQDRPFALTLLTVDSHFPNGYLYDDFPQPFNSSYGNAIYCSDSQVADFIAWFKQQDFYEDTSLIISGDHLTMASQFMLTVDPNYDRTVYNLFVNPQVPADYRPEFSRGRDFTTMDMFPSTLAALGVHIKGDRLGYGCNLFAGQETLPEKLGWEKFSQMMNGYSAFYNKEFLYSQ